MYYPSKEELKQIRCNYPVGSRVELVYTNDPWTELRPGARGTVSMVDGVGIVYVDWDNGSELGMLYRVDRIKRV